MKRVPRATGERHRQTGKVGFLPSLKALYITLELNGEAGVEKKGASLALERGLREFLFYSKNVNRTPFLAGGRTPNGELGPGHMS